MAVVHTALEYYRTYVIEMGDERTKGWFLIDSPIPVLLILIAYYTFVQHIGPWLMRDRKPFDLRSIILAYNALQVCICLLFLYSTKRAPFEEDWTCSEVFMPNQERNYRMAVMGWVYYMVKFLDLVDTIFFVLRKKQTHVTFLHLFHHISMVLVTWAMMKYIASGVIAIGPLLNMWVHSFMYSYYFAVLYFGKVDLFWKKLMTKIQLVQFLVGNTIFIINFLNPHCGFPKLLLAPVILHGCFFIYLFSKFYYNAYIRHTSEKSK